MGILQECLEGSYDSRLGVLPRSLIPWSMYRGNLRRVGVRKESLKHNVGCSRERERTKCEVGRTREVQIHGSEGCMKSGWPMPGGVL